MLLAGSNPTVPSGEGSLLSLINGTLCDNPGAPIVPVDLSSLDAHPLHSKFKLAICLARANPSTNGIDVTTPEGKFFNPVENVPYEHSARRSKTN